MELTPRGVENKAVARASGIREAETLNFSNSCGKKNSKKNIFLCVPKTLWEQIHLVELVSIRSKQLTSKVRQQEEKNRKKLQKKNTEMSKSNRGKAASEEQVLWTFGLESSFFFLGSGQPNAKKKHFLSSLPTRIVVIETAIDVLKKNTFEKGLWAKT